MTSILKQVFEFGPLIIFFAAYFLGGGMFEATKYFMVATVIGIAGLYALERKVSVVQVFTAVVVIVAGGLTLYLHDERFIKMKPTIVYLVFAGILLGGLMSGHLLIKYVLGKALQLEEKGWRVLTFRFGLFFLFAAALNEFIWRNFSEEFWISFKVWGFMSLTMVFMVWQTLAISKYQIPSESGDE